MSDAQADHSRLAELAAKVGLHEHLCLIYDTHEEQLAAALPYFRAGLEQGEKCLYIGDRIGGAAVWDALRRDGIDVDGYVREGALTVVDENGVYLKVGHFDPDLMIGFWIEAVREAKAEGFPGLRVLAEMTWTLADNAVPASLIEFESKVNHMNRDHDIAGMCQYSRSRFPPEVILGVLRTHPVVVYGGLVSNNPYYVPPDEFLKPNQPAREVERLLKNILEWEQAQHTLRRSEERWRSVFENSAIGVALTDLKGRYLAANPVYQKLVGYTEEELRARSFLDITHEDYRAANWALITELVERKRQQFQIEKKYRFKDGSLIWVSNNVSLLPGSETVPRFIMALSEDITERKRAEEALRDSEERFRALFESVQVGVVVTGPRAEVLMCNPAALSLLGVTEDQLLGTTPYDPKWRTIHEDGSPWPPESHPVPEVLRTGHQVRNVLMGLYRPLLHDLIWLLVSAQPQFAPDGRVSRVICAFEDITERKRAEDDLRRQKEVLQKIFDNVPIMISFARADGRIELVNREWERTIGWTLEEIGEENLDIFAETYPDPQRRQKVREFVAAAEGKFADFRTRVRDGRVIDTTWVRVRLSDGTSVGMGRDITERKRAEERLRQSEADLAEAQRVAKLGNWRFDIATGTVRWSEELYRIFEVEKTAFGGTYGFFLSRVHSDDRSRVVETNRKARVTGEPFDLDYRIVTPGGELKNIREIGYATKDATGSVMGLFGTAQDITEPKRAEEAQRETEERFHKVFEEGPFGISFLGLDNRFLAVNKRLSQLLGYTQDELCRLTFSEITHPDDIAKEAELTKQLFAGVIPNFRVEKRLIKKSGEILWGNLAATLIRGADRMPLYGLGMLEDITERKQAEEELQRSRDQLRAFAARLQRVREEERTGVAREIHDELSQALTGIKLDLSSLSRELTTDQKQRAAAILTLIDETIRSVRTISTELRPAVLDASGLVAAIEWAAEEFGTRAGIKYQMDLPPDDVVIDQERATALFRIFQETLTNVARHANATEIKVRLAKETDSLILQVSDNGKGISAEQLSASSSLGILGMRERALLVGGDLSIRGEPGKGTTVTIRIPAS